jgi:hypothetical protein
VANQLYRQSPDRAANYALYRAAQLALKQHIARFVVIDRIYERDTRRTYAYRTDSTRYVSAIPVDIAPYGIWGRRRTAGLSPTNGAPQQLLSEPTARRRTGWLFQLKSPPG